MIVQGLVILKEIDGEATMPIWVGPLEATVIASELEKVASPRPITHNLLRNLIAHMSFWVERVEVVASRTTTFYALIQLMCPQEAPAWPPPPDATALVLRAEAPIFVARRVLEQTGVTGKSESEDAEQKRKDLLEKMDPDDFGKYKMCG
ncbi:Bifunctional nuclease family protein [Desulfarculales bacterium]